MPSQLGRFPAVMKVEVVLVICICVVCDDPLETLNVNDEGVAVNCARAVSENPSVNATTDITPSQKALLNMEFSSCGREEGNPKPSKMHAGCQSSRV